MEYRFEVETRAKCVLCCPTTCRISRTHWWDSLGSRSPRSAPQGGLSTFWLVVHFRAWRRASPT